MSDEPKNPEQEQLQEKQLVIKTNYFDPAVWSQMKEMSTTFIQSKAMPSYIQNAAQAVVVMQAGFEMGMKPMESLKSLYIVNGSVNIWGAAITKRLREHGWSIDYKEITGKVPAKIKAEMDEAGITSAGGGVKATVTKGQESYSEEFYFYQAVMSGWTKTRDGGLKVGWNGGANRRLKLRYAALSLIIKTHLAEVMGSATDIKEVAEDYPMDDIQAEEGQVIDEPETKDRASKVTDFINKNKGGNLNKSDGTKKS